MNERYMRGIREVYERYRVAYETYETVPGSGRGKSAGRPTKHLPPRIREVSEKYM